MSEQIVGYRPPQAARPRCLDGYNLAITAGTEVELAAVDCPANLIPVLESLYYDGGAGGTGYLKFLVRLNGVQLPYRWANSPQPIGQVGRPEPIGQELPPGSRISVCVQNNHPTDPFEGYCDGEVRFYDRPIR